MGLNTPTSTLKETGNLKNASCKTSIQDQCMCKVSIQLKQNCRRILPHKITGILYRDGHNDTWTDAWTNTQTDTWMDIQTDRLIPVYPVKHFFVGV